MNPLNPLDVIRDAQTRQLVDEDGYPVPLELNPGLTDEELANMEQRLPCKLPSEIRALLKVTRGFDGIAADQVDFTGEELLYEQADVFPRGLPIASDGCGNFWVIDLTPESKTFGPVYFACHDAPVILFQSETLTEFLSELFKCVIPPHSSLVNEVRDDRLHEVWRRNPGVQEQSKCLQSSDELVRRFAEGLDQNFQVVDLRGAIPGQGFSWGRYGPRTEIRRNGNYPIFAYKKKGWLARIFGS